ncbi:MAG: hypothetical protein HFJ27_03315 [Clostridia bacterium]|nr:hypothetical protein [Clostridia bacterium]
MIIIGIISIVIYIVAILMVVTNTYEFEKEKKIKFIIIGGITILLATWLIVMISSSAIKIDNHNVLSITKMTSILIFAPLNTMAILPYLGNVLNKYKQKRLEEKQVEKRIIILVCILVIMMIIEVSYIKDFEIGLLNSITK